MMSGPDVLPIREIQCAIPAAADGSPLQFHRATYSQGDIRRDDYLLILQTNTVINDGRYIDLHGSVWIVQLTLRGTVQAREVGSAMASTYSKSEFEQSLAGMVMGVLHIENPYMLTRLSSPAV